MHAAIQSSHIKSDIVFVGSEKNPSESPTSLYEQQNLAFITIAEMPEEEERESIKMSQEKEALILEDEVVVAPPVPPRTSPKFDLKQPVPLKRTILPQVDVETEAELGSLEFPSDPEAKKRRNRFSRQENITSVESITEPKLYDTLESDKQISTLPVPSPRHSLTRPSKKAAKGQNSIPTMSPPRSRGSKPDIQVQTWQERQGVSPKLVEQGSFSRGSSLRMAMRRRSQRGLKAGDESDKSADNSPASTRSAPSTSSSRSPSLRSNPIKAIDLLPPDIKAEELRLNLEGITDSSVSDFSRSVDTSLDVSELSFL